MKPWPAFEREFLQLAKWMLACNLRVMGGEVLECPIPNDNLEGSLLGLMDHCIEMRLICRMQLTGTDIGKSPLAKAPQE